MRSQARVGAADPGEGCLEHIAGRTTEQMARMEREMEKVQRDLKTVESRYGEDVLQLVIASGY
jgi:hypothetical protein